MEQITAYLLNILELLEKELQLFKRLSIKTFRGMGWFAMGVLLSGVGLMVLAWTCFHAIISLLGPVVAGLVASILILSGGGVFLWISKQNLK